MSHQNPSPTAPVAIGRIDSPVGRIEFTGNGRAVTTLSIEKDGHLPLEAAPERLDRILQRAARQLGAYFAGSRKAFTVPLEARGTPFQHAIWDQLSALDWGEVTTYGELGRNIGRTSAGRAVGGAIGANPLPILVPCHRVLGTDGGVTGYSRGNGIPTKLWLLEHEGVLLAA